MTVSDSLFVQNRHGNLQRQFVRPVLNVSDKKFRSEGSGKFYRPDPHFKEGSFFYFVEFIFQLFHFSLSRAGPPQEPRFPLQSYLIPGFAHK